jgi:hypothetical protein
LKTNPNPIEQEIIATLDAAVQHLDSNKIYGDRNWTNCFKEKLAELGEQKGNKICTSGFADQYDAEWLFDMVWYKENEKKYLTEVFLAVESEWGSHLRQIKFDFEKLLSSNSLNKLMICQTHPSNYDALVTYFEEAIGCYKGNKAGDRYLVAILDKKEEKFYYEVFQK